MQALLAWHVRAGGSVHGEVEFKHDESMGLAGFARGEIEKDAVIVSLPVSVCITTQHAREWIEGQFGSSSQQAGSGLNDKDWIILYLVLHKIALRNEQAQPKAEDNGESEERPQKRSKLDEAHEDVQQLPHREYVALLPDEVVTPLHFTQKEVELLQNTPLHAHAARRRKQTRQACKRASQWLRQHPTAASTGWQRILKEYIASSETGGTEGPTQADEDITAKDIKHEIAKWGKDEKEQPLLGVWRWAETAHGSRAFPPHLIGDNGAPILLPVYDLFNHSRDARVTWTHEHGSKVGSDTDPAGGAKALKAPHVTLTVHDGIAAGQQVFNSYGPKSNEELLASYGFVNEGLQDDAVTLRLGSTAYMKVPADPTAQSQQHYWKYNERCPESLKEEILAQLAAQGVEHPLDVDSELNAESGEWSHIQGVQRESLRVLMDRAYVFEVVVELLETKLKAFRKSQAAFKAVKAEPDGKIRPSVLHNVSVYRNSQLRILQWAQESAQREEEASSRKVEQIIYDDQASPDREPEFVVPFP